MSDDIREDVAVATPDPEPKPEQNGRPEELGEDEWAALRRQVRKMWPPEPEETR